MILISGNPLICNCHIIWLKSWLSESTSVGPKCSDGTYVKGMPFGRDDCPNTSLIPVDEDIRTCMTHENEALLPNLATSQVFSTLDKVKDYATQIKNNYQVNKVNRPLPEESEYFYDDYVDYPYNETLIESLNNEISASQSHNHNKTTGRVPTIYAEMKNTTQKTTPNPPAKPSTGFTFFGMPIPPIDVSKLLNSGRKMDWSEKKTHSSNTHSNKKYEMSEVPKFETGGFSPILPTTDGGFMPIPDPSLNVSKTNIKPDSSTNYNKQANVEQTIAIMSTKPPIKTMQTNTTHKKIKSEIHELQAYLDDDNGTHVAYNRTKNIEEQNTDPNNVSKYNLMESNLTISQVTEKDSSMLITTDTSNDMSLQAWMESSTSGYFSSTSMMSKPPMKKHIEQPPPTALSAVLVPSNAELIERNSKRPATITKVNLPQLEHIDHNYSANREPKTRFQDIMTTSNTKTRQVDDSNDWYYKNYNNSNLKPYVAPGVHKPKNDGYGFSCNIFLITVSLLITIHRVE